MPPVGLQVWSHRLKQGLCKCLKKIKINETKTMKRFENQVAVISGGADGLGFGIAERIASEGGSVTLFDINQTVLTKALKTFEEKGYKAQGYKVDISSEYEVERA